MTTLLSLLSTIRARLLAALCITALLLPTPQLSAIEQSQQSKPLRIAVAANFAATLELLMADLPNKDQFQLQIISAATGTIYQQIKHGAPFDIFLSADALRPELLERAGLILADSRKTYAYGQIALWSATDRIDSFAVLDNYHQHFAIANPDTAPYGKAAQQALMHLSRWQPLKAQLITGINISQTFQQVRSQAVPLGIVAYSQLLMNNYQGLLIPTSYYQPIAQQLVILKSSQQQALAEKITAFILQANSQEKLQQLGYLPANTQVAIEGHH
ncbi:molybdate transport system substrate-binding protein [Colwellia chukchiensis]|uniref:Molybdate transport system substrate-binding protein n=1 Tax=Colwellia chukchiensis TaxID=641665 RepID=A0A1H7JM23_9GAMM|nr:molybdate ABC transporter substrate-binding protein [Colwellia chukchiensis]SEK74515.1 molybdate transport system substrate-binding protein [Colwellia chukchiensis]